MAFLATHVRVLLFVSVEAWDSLPAQAPANVRVLGRHRDFYRSKGHARRHQSLTLSRSRPSFYNPLFEADNAHQGVGAIFILAGATSLCRVLTGTPSLNSSASASAMQAMTRSGIEPKYWSSTPGLWAARRRKGCGRR